MDSSWGMHMPTIADPSCNWNALYVLANSGNPTLLKILISQSRFWHTKQGYGNVTTYSKEFDNFMAGTGFLL